MGMSQTLLTTFCGMMDMPPPICSKAYAKCNNLVLAASKKEVMKEQLAASAELHDMAAAGTLFVPSPLVEADSDSELEEDESDCDTDDCEGTSDLSYSDDCEGTSLRDSDDCEGTSDLSDSEDCEGSDLRDSDDGEGTSDLSDHENAQSRRPGGVEPIYVTVTYDGTWSKRGFTALYGVGHLIQVAF